MSLFAELKRRNVIRVALAYAVVAWLLLQIGDTLAPALLLPDWVTRFLAFVLILGFPLALFFAWAFELTPEGIRPEKAISRDDSITQATGRKLDRMIIALLAVAVAYFAWDKFAERSDGSEELQLADVVQTDERRSIAVLPFVNMSGDAEQEYFSDGLSEELLNLLARIPQLRVTSRSSAFSFKGKDFTIGEVGEKLGVAYVLEGSVRRSGGKIRITAQLIEVSADAHMWSDTWDREFENVFAIQDDIAAEVVNALKIQLVDELPHVYVTNPEAYDLFLQARKHYEGQTEDGAYEAERLLKQLLEIDPTYVPGLLLLGNTARFIAVWGFQPADEYFEIARSYGEKVVEIAPTNVGGYLLLALIADRYDNDRRLVTELLDQALRLDPQDVDVRMSTGFHLALKGDFERYTKAAQEVVELDPLSGVSYWRLGHALMVARQHDDSVAAFRRLLELSPEATAGHAALAEALFLAGKYNEALIEFEAEPIDGFTHYGYAMTYFELGDHDKSDIATRALYDLEDVEIWAAQLAMVHSVRGEVDDAMRWLHRALELNDQGIRHAAINPFFDNLRDDPRFVEFLEQLGSGKN